MPAASPIKAESVKWATVVVGAAFVALGILFHDTDFLRPLIEGVNPSFLPGF